MARPEPSEPVPMESEHPEGFRNGNGVAACCLLPAEERLLGRLLLALAL